MYLFQYYSIYLYVRHTSSEVLQSGKIISTQRFVHFGQGSVLQKTVIVFTKLLVVEIFAH